MPSFPQQYDLLSPDAHLIRSSSANLIDPNSFRYSHQRPDSHHQPSHALNSKPTNQPNRRNSLAKLNDFRKKVHQVIELCAHQNADVKTDLSQVFNEEKKVYDLLVDNPSLLIRTVSHQNFPPVPPNMQQTIPYYQNPLGQSQKPQQIKTPFRPQKTQKIPQSQYYIPNASQVALRQSNYPPNSPYLNPSKPQPTYFPQDFQAAQFGQPIGTFNSPENLQGSFLRLKNNPQITLNEDALRLIQEIERRAFQEIQKLRKQKLELMQRLNQQIKNVNEEKKKNVELQNILARQGTESQNPDGFSVGAGQNTQYLQGQINRLQQELQRTNQINHNLRLELSNRGSGVPGIEELLRQGEAIRQETLKLIKLKEQGDGGDLRLQELERKLIAEQSEKQAALNEVRSLRERLGVSQIRGFEESKVNEKSGNRNRVSQPVKSVGQYEDLVSEMKRITGL